MSLLSQLFGGGGGNPLSFPSEDYIIGDCLLVGGGGGSSNSGTADGGGGGGGRVVTVDNIVLKVGDTGTITIGAGATGESTTGYLGESSYFYPGQNAQSLHAIVAAGGGAATDNNNGYNGGCGAGGGGAPPTGTDRTAGIATDRNLLSGVSIIGSNVEVNSVFAFSDGPVVISKFISSGSPGGDGTITDKAGGGGGAGRDDYTARTPTNPDGSIGQNSSPSPGVNSLGGAGYVSSITGVAVTYGQGGDGGTLTKSKPAVPIPPNTGHGGHGGLVPSPGIIDPQSFGSDGVFVIRWPTSYPQATSVTGNDGTLPVNAVPGYYTYRWITPGTITY